MLELISDQSSREISKSLHIIIYSKKKALVHTEVSEYSEDADGFGYRFFILFSSFLVCSFY